MQAMTCHDLTNILPNTSFLPFSAVRLEDPEILWRNIDTAECLDLSSYAYCLPVAQESGKLKYGANSKVLLGEKYGGEGVGVNAGGARCGLIEGLQIKGVGRNALAGEESDFFHSYGGAQLSEAILEAIWGEICSTALPYGGARTHGILATGTKVPMKFPKSNEASTTPRVLIIREPKLRPGHFMRSIYCRGSSVELRGASDASRTRAALSRLADAFQAIDLVQASPKSSAEEILLSGMNAFLARQAKQIATARSKRIMHGSLTASNLSLDGAWLDFTSISAVSDYGRILIPRGAPDFLHEEEIVVKDAKNLYFYIWKYLTRGDIKKAWLEAESGINRFRLTLKKQLQNEFSTLSGIPITLLSGAPPQLISSFFSSLEGIYKHGNARAFRILSEDNDYDPVMPPVMGDYHLSSIISQTALSEFGLLDDGGRLKELLPNDRLRGDLLKSYGALVKFFDSVAHGKKKLRDFIKINAIRKNSENADLYRTELYPRIRKTISCRGEIRPLIESVLASSLPTLANDVDGVVDLSVGPKPIRLCASRGLYANGDEIEPTIAAELLIARGANKTFCSNLKKINELTH